MRKKRLLFISNLYPNPRRPHMASFNRQQVAALHRHLDVEVIAPVSWRERGRGGALPQTSTWGEVIAHHPTYWYTPAWGRRFYGRFYLHSIRSLVLRLNRERAFDFVFGAWLYPDGWAAAKIAQELGVPLFLKVHGTDVNRLVGGTRLTALSMQVIEQAQTVFCVSQALKDKLIGVGCSPDKLAVVYNGVNKEIFFPISREEARGALGVCHDRHLVLYVGNLKKTKGLVELISAFGGLKNSSNFQAINLVLVGQGAFKTEVEQIIHREGVASSVSFLGALSLNEVALWMNAANVLCLPSHMEGTPNVVLEALSCNTRVVATAVGGVPELACLDSRVALAEPQNIASLQVSLENSLCKSLVGEKRLAIQTWGENASVLASIMLEG